MKKIVDIFDDLIDFLLVATGFSFIVLVIAAVIVLGISK